MAIVLASSPLEKEPFLLKAFHGKERAIHLARLRVPADHRRPGGRTYELGAHVFPAKVRTLAPPVVFLMGGPGIPGTVLSPIPPYFDLFDRLSEGADVVVLDQRGIGLSVPKVDCPPPAQVPPDLFESKARLLAAFQAVNATCAEHWRKSSVEPADFAIEQVADDVASLRAAMGVSQVDLLAFSYGTRIATEVLRRHPGMVRKAVLQGVLLGATRMPERDDRTFRAVAALARQQAVAKGFVPDLEVSLRAIQQQLDRAPLEMTARTLAGREIRIRVGRETFDAVVASRLGDRRLPALLTAMARGDSSLLAQWIEALYQDLEKGSSPLMRAAILCSAADDRHAADTARRQAPRSLLGDPFDNLQQSEPYCRVLGIARPGKRAAVRATTPVLMISGTLDDRTPVERAEEVLRSFAVRGHVVVRNGGHELLPEPKVQDAVLAFLRDDAVTTTTIDLAPPEYPDVEAAKRPARGTR